MAGKNDFCFIVIFLYLAVALAKQLEDVVEVTTKEGNDLKLGSVHKCCKGLLVKEEPIIYCYKGDELRITWAQAKISLHPDDFKLYWGRDTEEVKKLFVEGKPVFIFYPFEFPKYTILINPLKKTCFGIVSRKDYSLNVTERVDMVANPLNYQVGLWLFVFGEFDDMSAFLFIFFATWMIFIPLMTYLTLYFTLDLHQDDIDGGNMLFWNRLFEYLLENKLIKHISCCVAVLIFSVVLNVTFHGQNRIEIKQKIMVIGLAMMVYSNHDTTVLAFLFILITSLFSLHAVRIHM